MITYYAYVFTQTKLDAQFDNSISNLKINNIKSHNRFYKFQDLLMVVYLSNLTRTQLLLNEKMSLL